MFRLLKRIIKYFYHKIKNGRKVSFSCSSEIGIRSTFEGYNKIYPHSIFVGNMGCGTYVAEHSYIEGKVGRFTSIGAYTRVITGTHPYTSPFVSTSPMFFHWRNKPGIRLQPDNVLRNSDIQRVELLLSLETIVG